MNVVLLPPTQWKHEPHTFTIDQSVAGQRLLNTGGCLERIID